MKMSRFAQFRIRTMGIEDMPAPIILDPQHWRDRAARMQALAVKQ